MFGFCNKQFCSKIINAVQLLYIHNINVKLTISINYFVHIHGSRHDVVDVATGYRLAVRISNSGKVIASSPKPSRPERGTIQPSIQWAPWTFPGNKEAGTRS
jgi:hypothetical protein